MKRLLLIATIAILGLSALQAQNTCGDQLKVAQRRFDDGLLEDIPQLLATCMKSGFTDEEKTNAYKLLIQTYLFSENQDKADEVMLQFLKEFPSYAIANNDPKEFVNLYSTYRTEPIFKIEFKGNGQLSIPLIIEPNGVGDLKSKTATYKPTVGFGLELNYIDHLYKDFDFSVGASFIFSRLNYSSTPLDFISLTGIYTNIYVGVPFTVRYNFKFKGFNLFARFGVEPVYLVSSNINLTRKDNIPSRPDPISGTEDLTSLHRKLDIRPTIAFGPTFKLWKGQLKVALELKFATISQLPKENKYKNQVLFEKYKFVEDNMLFSQSNLSIAYILPIYKPKKIR